MDWKSKLTSRKFWAAVASFAAMLVITFGGGQEQATQITAIIMAGATVVAYIVGEGLIDAAAAGSTVNADTLNITSPSVEQPKEAAQETAEKTAEIVQQQDNKQ
ncbi:hypothetical protein [Caproicibacter fermentans]|uniref:hypothetical protein n=1 Tax=Caproicibacter fermentans TaxID=2576756 RepID=UPI001E3E1BFD|nr:hypothetical protein [Caproicibacter fermentans]